ncbi:MAG: ABC transporter ATP-binding protein [Thermodesulfobacteriota bacterium]
MVPLLKIDKLTKRFGGLVAVADLDVEINQGEIVSLIGPNGAGKTTVFNMVTGFYKPDQGSILFNNHELGGLKSHLITGYGIARTFQNIRLFSDMTVFENMVVARQCRAKSGIAGAVLRTALAKNEEKEDRERLLGLLAFFNLQDSHALKASALPYGKQRRLEIARALATDPRLLLLDEPTAGMNPQESESLMELISSIVKEMQITILLIEHNMNLVMEISNRIAVLDHGIKIAEGTSEQIQSNEAVIKAYLGDTAFRDVDH